jgi:hypothetical protein
VRLLRIVPAHTNDAASALSGEDIEDFRDLQRYPDWREMTAAFLTYIECGSETPLHRIASLAAQIGPEVEEVYVSTADMLRAEGHAKGRAEEAARLLVRLLVRQFGAVPDEVRERIDTASLDQLEAWCDRVLDATTLDDVFS